jgi:hypothetical protein
VWQETDTRGREIVLEWKGWSHIQRRHPYLGLTPEEIVAVAVDPDERVPGRTASEEWLYRKDIGPSDWVKVVVHFDSEHGLIVTAYPRRSFP